MELFKRIDGTGLGTDYVTRESWDMETEKSEGKSLKFSGSLKNLQPEEKIVYGQSMSGHFMS